MSLENPTIAIIGAGAVGGYYGARLAQAGFDVHFLLRSDYQAVRQSGWLVRSCDGDFSIPPHKTHVYNDPRQMPKADLVIVTLKTTANDQMDRLVAPVLKDDSILLTLQNGLGNEELLAGLFGPARVLGGMAFVCINRLADAVIHHMDHGTIRLGEFSGPPVARTHRIVEMFRQSRVDCIALDDLKFGRWLKLIWNVPFNGLGAALNMDTQQLLQSPVGIELVTDMMREVREIARSQGVDLPEEVIQKNIDSTRTMGAYRSSMQIDRQMNRPMEVQAILGEVVARAERNSILPKICNLVHRQLCVINACGQ